MDAYGYSISKYGSRPQNQVRSNGVFLTAEGVVKRFVAVLMLMSGLLGLNLESFAADGTPDTTFSTNIGSGFNSDVYGVAVQSDGKIVVGGVFTTINGTTSNYIARLNADGTPDTTFSTNIGSGFNSDVYGVAVQSDGKIVVGGNFTTINGTASNRIARLNADGTPDTTFSTNIGSGFDGYVNAVAVQSDGKIVVVGGFNSINGTASSYIARLNADGTPDTTFSTNIGSGFNNLVRGVAVQSDGKIVVGGGFTSINGTTSSYIARLNADGTPDTTFSTNIGSGFNATVNAVAVQSDGKIVVVGGFNSINGTASNRIARLNANGTPDTTFSTNIGTGFNAFVYGFAVQSDGKIVVGGFFTTINGTASNRIARLNANGTPDTTFSTNIGSGFNNRVYGVAIQSDGKIVVGGGFTTINGTVSNYIARLNGTATPAPQAIPTLSEWTLLLLGLMVMATLGWYWNRERSY